jgi:hypothetical protein
VLHNLPVAGHNDGIGQVGHNKIWRFYMQQHKQLVSKILSHLKL